MSIIIDGKVIRSYVSHFSINIKENLSSPPFHQTKIIFFIRIRLCFLIKFVRYIVLSCNILSNVCVSCLFSTLFKLFSIPALNKDDWPLLALLLFILYISVNVVCNFQGSWTPDHLYTRLFNTKLITVYFTNIYATNKYWVCGNIYE